MRARIVEPARGLAWLAEGWQMFRAAPFGWLVIVFTYMMGSMLLSALPLVGTLAWFMLMPAFLVGFMTASRAASRRHAVELGMLVAGFRERVSPQLVLGVVNSLGFAAAAYGSALLDGGELVQSLRNSDPGEAAEAFPLGLLAAVLLYLPVEVLLWFSPMLVAWHGVAPTKAIFYSGAAVWLNLRAFVVYAIALTALLFAVAGLLTLLVSTLSSRTATAAVQSLMLPVALFILPMLYASHYASYRDVFAAENG